ncbi:unnamed protein product [Lymnaea stagnalis]|uniref:TNFR-Cys domain-containing protein n=1 Tax=Lymnaea stagnalis TaxID=6523 RepID=A0AAV2I623_LYMST
MESLVVIIMCISSGVAAVSVCDSCDVDVPSRQLQTSADTSEKTCNAGYYAGENKNCQVCPNGTFLTSKMARERKNRSCQTCYVPQKEEEIVHECNATRDTEITCKQGYYRSDYVKDCTCLGRCEQCQLCSVGTQLYNDHEARPCSHEHNTLCCETEDMVAGADGCVKPSPVPHAPTTATTTTTTTHRTSSVDGSNKYLSITEGFHSNSANISRMHCFSQSVVVIVLCALLPFAFSCLINSLTPCSVIHSCNLSPSLVIT